VPYINHCNACIGLIVLGLTASGPESLTEYRSVLLDGQLFVCAFTVRAEWCAEVFTNAYLIVLLVLLLVVVDIAVAALVLIAIVVKLKLIVLVVVAMILTI